MIKWSFWFEKLMVRPKPLSILFRKRVLCMITNKDIMDYKRDGVICEGNAISDHLIEVSRRGIGKSLAKPGQFSRDYTATASLARYLFEYRNWWNIRELEELAFDNSIASLVANILEAGKVFLLMDQWFHREAVSTNAATWHQDEAYFDFLRVRNV